MRAWLWLLLAGGCSFDVPHEQDARADCLAYADAIVKREQECGDDPARIAQSDAENRAHCGKVVAENPLGPSVTECINEYRATPCAEQGQVAWCDAFL